jgi:hypothetical protein
LTIIACSICRRRYEGRPPQTSHRFAVQYTEEKHYRRIRSASRYASGFRYQTRLVLGTDGAVLCERRCVTYGYYGLDTDGEHTDIILTETGTSSFGLINVPLPSDSTYLAQVLWGSIGWSVGAALGAALGGMELGNRRTTLFVGDGSLQLVCLHLNHSCMN